MGAQPGWIVAEDRGDRLILRAGGVWALAAISDLDAKLSRMAPSRAVRAAIDMTDIERLDTAGAWLLHRTRKRLRERGVEAEYEAARPAHAAILERIAAGDREQVLERDELSPLLAMLERFGRALHAAVVEAADLLNFLGAACLAIAGAIARPRRIRLVALLSHIERTGLDALPIVGLLSFLIGVVIAFQGADQLHRFGAEIFTVNLLGVSMLREMAVLLTAIIVAGRSGSAFTAQIGTMQVNQEIDAMRTIGLDPLDVLVLPRVLALVIAMPLLSVFADVMGVVGGAVMLLAALDISLVQFIERFQTVVPISAFWIGLVKAPVFGLLIALVGCREGLKVGGSAESVGLHTTRSVVISIFLVIIVDAIFSIFFSMIGI